MYCPHCGESIQTAAKGTPHATHCPSCQEALPRQVQGAALPTWAAVLVRPRYFGSVFLLLLLLVAGLMIGVWWRNRLPAPGQTVQDFYTAIAARDKDTLRALIVPEERDLGLGFCLNLLTQPTVSAAFEDVTTRTVSNNRQAAEVRATGQVKRELDGRQFEIGFNDVFELVAVDRTWHIKQRSLSALSLCGDL